MMDFDLLLDIKSMIDEEKDDVYFCVDWAVRCSTTLIWSRHTRSSNLVGGGL